MFAFQYPMLLVHKNLPSTKKISILQYSLLGQFNNDLICKYSYIHDSKTNTISYVTRQLGKGNFKTLYKDYTGIKCQG